MKKSLLPILLLLGACAQTAPVGRTAADHVDDSFARAGGLWTTGKPITVAAKVLNSGGAVAVCGAWAVGRGSNVTSSYDDRIIEAGVIELEGRTILRNLDFMAEARGGAIQPGARANCVVTSTPWQAGYEGAAPEIYLPRQTFGTNSLYDEKRVTFRQVAFSEIGS